MSYTFNSENFEEKWFDEWTVVFYFEKEKDEQFEEFLGHAKKWQRTFYRFSDIKKFLAIEENDTVKIYITIWEEDIKPFIKVDDGFLIDLKSYIEFQKTIRSWGSMKAFLTQTFNIHSADQNQIDLLVAQNTKEENIIEILKKLPKEKQATLLQSLQAEFWKWWNFDLKSDWEWIFLQIGEIENRDIVIEQLKKLEQNKFANIESALSISKIDQALEIWKVDKNNSHEVSFWQKFLKDNPWILSQVFPAPYAIFENEFYVWWHYSGSLSWSKKTDFWYKSLYFWNTAIIEIKTPTTNLVSKNLYGTRKWIYPMSDDLIGAISQVLNQKDLLQKDYLQNNAEKDFKVWNPKIILIVWSNESEKMNKDQIACFELFKNSNKDIDIITFDELFEKISLLRQLY